ncbi:MAG: GAF and ANTAR domain-containing protein [Nocardioidaceae bacterium]
MTDTELVELMATVAKALRTAPEDDDTLRRITETAVSTIPGVDYASISITGSDGIRTLAPTATVVVRADELQYELDEGPCVDAIKFEQTMRSEDVAADDQWPKYGPETAALGIRGQMAVQICDTKDSHAALNLYSRAVGAFDNSQHIAELFATHAAVAMGFVRSVETLKEALKTRNMVGQAIGVTMQRYGLDEENAFAFLVRVSQQGNLKLRFVAQEIIDQANREARAQQLRPPT